jgi:hypothetical protein
MGKLLIGHGNYAVRIGEPNSFYVALLSFFSKSNAQSSGAFTRPTAFTCYEFLAPSLLFAVNQCELYINELAEIPIGQLKG